MPLFREQAVLALTRQTPYSGVLARPPGWRLYLTLALAFVVLSVMALATIELPRTALATGWLTPRHGLVQLQASMGGFVTDVYVAQGDTVRRGQALLRISADIEKNQGSMGVLLRQYDQEAQTLQARQHSLRDLLALRRTVQQKKLSEARRELGSAQRSEELQQHRLSLTQSAHNALIASFEAGAISRRDLDQSNVDLLAQEQALESMRAQVASQAGLLDQLPQENEREIAELQASRASADQLVLELEQRRTQLDLDRTQVLTAPISGRLVALDAHVGQQVTTRSRQAAILPQDSTLEAELHVPSFALGYVAGGDVVRLRYEPFPHQKFGSWPATIRLVSDVLQDNGSNSASQSGFGPTFKVTAKLQSQSVQLHTRAWPLQPDMRLSAQIVLERRKAWEWLLEPALDVLRR